MGVDYYASAVLGCEVTGKLRYEVEKRGCLHDAGDQPFCPKCGKQTVIKETVNIPEYEDDAIGAEDGPYLTVFSTTDNRRQIAGIGTTVDSDGCNEAQFMLVNFDEIKRQVREVLEPLGLWDETKFGMWSVMHCSY